MRISTKIRNILRQYTISAVTDQHNVVWVTVTHNIESVSCIFEGPSWSICVNKAYSFLRKNRLVE